ncbi:F-box protein CPR1-like [Argentina anserina]|uniref:F-box protein CPR1-like n=1 Tax=Argentina anserina TaxID=57926 RepID=UPI0021764952|nr:F-box protein CPR1-like [Potentilla anserina]
MRVCKAWNDIIHSQEFIEAQHYRSMKTNGPRTILLLKRNSYKPDKRISLSVCFDRVVSKSDVLPVRITQPLQHFDEKAFMVGYCNSLVCIRYSNSISNAETLVVWNPSIQRFKRIPFTPVELPAEWADNQKRFPKIAYGFGYDSINDDYKLVRVVQFTKDDDVVGSEVKIYSIKSNSWKKVQSLPCTKGLRMYFTTSRLSYLNGALHLLMFGLSDENRIPVIVSLDLATEMYDEFPTPTVCYYKKLLVLEVFGGYLGVCLRPYPPATFIDQSDVWIMKKYGVTATWTRLYTIEKDDMPLQTYKYCKPLLFSETREVVLLERGGMLWWYDFERKGFEMVVIPNKPRLFSTAICAGNLLLLDGERVINPSQ